MSFKSLMAAQTLSRLHLENEYPGSNIIFVTVTDDESRRIEQQPDNQTLAEIMVVLRKMFGEIPQAEDILVPRWWKNRFFGGTFSNWPIGVDQHQFQQLQAPVGKLYFSGEHTSEKYNGYVHGAYYSGIDAANAVLHCQAQGTCREGIEPSQKGKIWADELSGACIGAIQKERDLQKQAWSKKASQLEQALSTKCRN